MTDREEWTRLAEAATPGPWKYVENESRYSRSATTVWGSAGPGYGAIADTHNLGSSRVEQPANAAFIAAARTAVPALLASEAQALARAEKAEGENVRLREALIKARKKLLNTALMTFPLEAQAYESVAFIDAALKEPSDAQ